MLEPHNEGAWVPESLRRQNHSQNRDVLMDCYHEREVNVIVFESFIHVKSVSHSS